MKAEDATTTTLDENAALRLVADRLGVSTDLDELSDEDRARLSKLTPSPSQAAR